MPKTLGFDKVNRYETLEGLIEFIDSKVDQSVLQNSNVIFNSLNVTTDAIINGNLTVNGSTTTIDSTFTSFADNILLINSSENNAGVSLNLAGIEIDRGSLTNYQSVFQESTSLFKIGQVGNLQAVATREDSPLASGIMTFNSSLNRLDSTNTIVNAISFTSGTNSTTSANGTVSITGGLGITLDTRLDGKLYFKGTVYGNNISSNNFNELVIVTQSNLNLNVPSGSSIAVPTNVPLTFGTPTQKLISNGSSLTIQSGSSINLTPATNTGSVIIPAGNSLIFGTTGTNGNVIFDGTNLNANVNSGNFNINCKTSIINNTSSTNSTTGSLTLNGSIAISNTTNSSSLTSGGTFTTAGGMSIAKDVFIGGNVAVSSTTNAINYTTGAMVISGGLAVNKTCYFGNVILSNNFSGTPGDGTSLFTGGITFIDSVSPNSSNNTNFSFNAFYKSTISANNTNITTSNASTVYIQGAPIAGINETITNSYSLYIAEGDVRIDSSTIFINSLINSSNFLQLAKTLTLGSDFNYTPTTGVLLHENTCTLNDNVTANSGTTSSVNVNYFSQNTLTATNSNVVTTSASTLTIQGAPIAGTNQTISNVYSLLIKQGQVKIDDYVTINKSVNSTSSTTGSLLLNGSIAINNNTNATNVGSGGTFTTSGGAAIGLDTYIGGVLTLNGTINSGSLSSGTLICYGGVAINKVLTLGQQLNLMSIYSGTPGHGLNVVSSGTFTDTVSTTNSTTSFVSFNSFYGNTIQANNSGQTITNAATVYIDSASVPGSNETITNNYSLYINSGKTKLDNLIVSNTTNATNYTTGSVIVSGGIGIAKDVYINGITNLNQTNISTNNGAFVISGTNGINATVSSNSQINVTSGTLTLGSSNTLNINSSNGINLTSSSGDLTLSATSGNSTITANTINLNASTAINIGTNAAIPITFGFTGSTTTINSNLIVLGTVDLKGATTIIESSVTTISDTGIIVNNAPSGLSDGGYFVRRYQIANNSALGEVIQDTPYLTSSFDSGSSITTLTLNSSSSSVTNFYNGFWILITSGTGINQVRRIKSYNGTTKVATIYSTADNDVTNQGLDLVTAPSSGDGYSLFNNSYSVAAFSETNNEWETVYTPINTISGVIPINSYTNFHTGSLITESSVTCKGNLAVNTSSGNTFFVNSSVPEIDLINPSNTVNSETTLNFQALNSSNATQTYSQIVSKILNNSSGTLTSEVDINLIKNNTFSTFINLNSSNSLITVNKKVLFTDTTSSTNSAASVLLNGGLTITNTTNAASISSGGALTILGGCSISQDVFIAGIVNLTNTTSSNSSSAGVMCSSGITITNTTNATAVSSGGSLTLLGGLAVSKDMYVNGITYFKNTTHSINSTTSSIITEGGIFIKDTTNSSSSTSGGSLTTLGGIAVSKDIYIGGDIHLTGTLIATPNTPSITTSSLINVDSVTIANNKVIPFGNEVTLSLTFVVDTSSSTLGAYGSFQFVVPNVSTNFANNYSVVATATGYHSSDTSSILNLTVSTVSGTTNGLVQFTVGSITNTHIIHIIARYTGN